MRVGPYISGAAHAGLIGWLILGWGLSSDPMEFEVTEVSLISGDAFDAALRAGTPMAEVETSPTPVVPDVPDPAPALPAEDPTIDVPQPTDAPTPTPAPAPAVEPVPDRPADPAPQPTPPAPVPDAPDAPVAPIAAPAPNLIVEQATRPKPRPSQRISPQPVAPTPDAAVADTVQQATTPDTTPTEPSQTAEEATAPEEAASEIVTEAEQPSGAPDISLRPQARRPRPTQVAETAPEDSTPTPDTSQTEGPAQTAETATDTPDADDAIAAALADALAAGDGAPQRGDTAGQSLTATETGTFLGQIAQCWNMAAASTAAQQTTVALTFRLTPEGYLEPGTIARAGYTGGDVNAADIAYRVAEQAVTECQSRGRNGYDLPVEKYEQWKELKISFNPETMRLR